MLSTRESKASSGQLLPVLPGLAHARTTQGSPMSLGCSAHDASESLVHHQGLPLDGASPRGLPKGVSLRSMAAIGWPGDEGSKILLPV